MISEYHHAAEPQLSPRNSIFERYTITERWVRSCRRELLDRCLGRGERRLRHDLREYEHVYNQHRSIKP